MNESLGMQADMYVGITDKGTDLWTGAAAWDIEVAVGSENVWLDIAGVPAMPGKSTTKAMTIGIPYEAAERLSRVLSLAVTVGAPGGRELTDGIA